MADIPPSPNVCRNGIVRSGTRTGRMCKTRWLRTTRFRSRSVRGVSGVRKIDRQRRDGRPGGLPEDPSASSSASGPFACLSRATCRQTSKPHRTMNCQDRFFRLKFCTAVDSPYEYRMSAVRVERCIP